MLLSEHVHNWVSLSSRNAQDLSVRELCVLWSISGFLRPPVAAAGSAGGSLANGVGLRSEQRLAPF